MAFYPINAQGCDSIADLRGQAGTDGVTVISMGLLIKTDGLGGTFRWDSANTNADDGLSTIQATGVATGRWIRQRNSNTIGGNTTFNTNIGQSSAVIPHNAGIVPARVFFTATGPAILTNVWHDKSLDTTTTFTIKYNPLAILTTISFDWLVIKI